MKVVILLILALFAAVAVAKGSFSLSCTAECAAYYTCYARAAFTEKQPNCAYPSRCECKKPFFLNDEAESDQSRSSPLFVKLLIEHLKETKAIQNKFDSAAGRENDDTESDFSITCTAKCASYYVCKAKGAWKGDYSECSSPSGCDCTKFAWQKDEEESDSQFIKKLMALFKKGKKKQQQQQEQPQPEPAAQPESDDEDQEEADQALQKFRDWFSSKFASLKNFFNKAKLEPVASTQSDRSLPSRCYCIRAPCNCNGSINKKNLFVEESDQFLSNLKRWFDGKIAAIKQAVTKTQSDLSLAKLPIRRPKCVCFRAPCDCDKWFADTETSFGKLLKHLNKEGKFPTKKLVEGLKSKKLFTRIANKYLKKEDN